MLPYYFDGQTHEAIQTSALLGALFFNWQKTGRADWILEERARWSHDLSCSMSSSCPLDVRIHATRWVLDARSIQFRSSGSIIEPFEPLDM